MIAFVVCMSQNRVIGKNNELPWYLPQDFKHFKNITTGNTIVMGRKTFASMGDKPLPNRRNVILSRNQHFTVGGCDILHSKEEVLDLEQQLEQEGQTLFIIGGQKLFEMFMKDADKIYLTVIYEDFEGDTFFPELDASWEVIERKQGIKNEKNPYDYEFLTYAKKS